ncbi:MAG: HDOD domain-containing protein [Myxococcales bacterium FL481]|nr:MAG: HDOD domain-containing protein [Myxococcales bacterium FL481]
MKRVMFVDDEPHILAGLRQLLRKQRKVWDMHFAPGGEEAIEALAAGDFDVIVSDMRMPRIDGAALLTHVKDHYPDMVRIVLSGYSEQEAALRVVPIAHQFLCKPCDANTLKAVIARACSLQALLSDERVRRIVGGMSALPSAPETYRRLVDALADPNVSLAALVGIIERDAGLATKVLQIVNSAFFGLPKRTSSIGQAVKYIGSSMLKHLVLGVETFSSMEAHPDLPRFSAASLQAHSLLVGTLAKSMLDTDAQAAEDAMLAGMLHDVGKLVLATHLPDRLAEAQESAHACGHPLYQAESALFGITHAEIGAYLLGIWGLPYSVVEAVAFHHSLDRIPDLALGPALVVHTADALLGEVSPEDPPPPLDLDQLAAAGVADRLDNWRRLRDAAMASDEAA